MLTQSGCLAVFFMFVLCDEAACGFVLSDPFYGLCFGICWLIICKNMMLTIYLHALVLILNVCLVVAGLILVRWLFKS